jgi:hypothetical protein
MISGEPIPLDKKDILLLQEQLTETNLVMIAENWFRKPCC